MRAKNGYKEWKAGEKYYPKIGCIRIGKFLKWYFEKRTCRKWKIKNEEDKE